MTAMDEVLNEAASTERMMALFRFAGAAHVSNRAYAGVENGLERQFAVL